MSCHVNHHDQFRSHILTVRCVFKRNKGRLLKKIMIKKFFIMMSLQL